MPFSVADLERAYDLIAAAIDRTPPEQEADLLARLALTLAARLGSLQEIEAAVRIAEAPAVAEPPS